jgi:hypothetical protein
MKIFRDSVYGPMRIAFPADYAFYKRHGLFDSPQKDTRMRAFNAVMVPRTKISPVRRKVFSHMKDQMIKPFEKVLNNP